MRRGLVLIVLLALVTFFAGLGRAAIGDSDEAYYAESGREMVSSHDYLTPHYNFDVRFQKPILFYWLVAGAYQVAGVGPGPARWWAATSGLAMVLLTFWAARRWYDTPTANLAGVITATSIGFVSLARMALPDLPLAALTTALIISSLVAIFDPNANSRRLMLLAGVLAALAMLTKGPVGLAVAVLAVGGAVVADRRAARIRPVDLALAVLVCVAVAAPWYLLMTARHGTGYPIGFFLGDNVERFATTRFNDPRPVWFYLPILASGLLPWTPFLLLGIGPVRRWAQRLTTIPATERHLLMWCLLPLLFFSISVGKQPRYILPLHPPLAILLAWTIQLRLVDAERRGNDLLMRIVAGSAAVCMIVFGVLLYRAQPLLAGLVDLRILTAGATATVAAACCALAVSLAGPLRHLVPVLAASAAIAILAFQMGLASGGPEPVEEMARLVERHRDRGEPVGTYRVMVRNLVFYTHVKHTDLTTDEDLARFLKESQRVLCVMTRSDREAFEARTGQSLKRLGAVRYFNTAVVKARTLLFPDPERDVAVVELVTNR